MFRKLVDKLTKNDSGLKQIAFKSSSALIFRVVGMGMAYLFAILLTKTYGAEIFGLYALALVIVQMSSLISRLGIDSAAVKFLPPYIENKENTKLAVFYLKGWSVVFVLSGILTLAVYSLSDFMAVSIFDKPLLEEYFSYMAYAITPFSLLMFNAEVFRGYHKADWQVIAKGLLVPLLGVILLGVGLQAVGLTLYIFEVYLFLITISSAVTQILAIGLVLKKQNWLAIKKLKSPEYKDIFKLSFPMFLFSSTLLVTEWSNIILLGVFSTAENVGIYKVIVQISSINIIILTVVNVVLAPRISMLYGKDDIIGMKREVLESTKLIFFASLPIQLLLFVFGSKLLLLFGQEFTIGLLPLYILLAGQLFNSIAGPVGQVLNMTNGQDYLFKVSSLRFIITIFFNIILIPHFGLMGVVFTSIIGNIALNLFCILKIRQKFNYWSFYNPFSKK